MTNTDSYHSDPYQLFLHFFINALVNFSSGSQELVRLAMDVLWAHTEIREEAKITDLEWWDNYPLSDMFLPTSKWTLYRFLLVWDWQKHVPSFVFRSPQLELYKSQACMTKESDLLPLHWNWNENNNSPSCEQAKLNHIDLLICV